MSRLDGKEDLHLPGRTGQAPSRLAAAALGVVGHLDHRLHEFREDYQEN